jgi:hypothetical protein
LRQDPLDGSWSLTGACGAGQGAMVEQILRAHAEAELQADREKVRAEYGEEAVVPLPRSAAQRCLDALTQIFLDAVAAPGSAAANVVHNIVWSRQTFDTALAAIERNRTPDFDLDTYRCETIDGVPVDPIEAAVQSLVHAARRVVLDASGTVIDLGRPETTASPCRPTPHALARTTSLAATAPSSPEAFTVSSMAILR